MTESERYAEILQYVDEGGRVCPQPMRWNELWDMLSERRRIGTGWEPAMPLILAGWWGSSAPEKRTRFLEHLEWAHRHGCIDAVGSFLRSLPEIDWFHIDD
jgi:hypothetical protein